MGLSTHWRSARDHVRVWVPHWRIDAPRAGVSRRRHPVLRWTAAIVAVLIVIIVVGSFFINEPLRRYMESTLNKDLKGYSVRLPGLVFNPLLGFKITFKGLTIIQNQHPQPPVAKFTAISARVQGGGLLHGRLVADFLVDHPQLHVNLPQLETEAKDKTPVKQKGWQQALEDMYPLKINHFRIRDGEITYIDKDPQRPLRIAELNVTAENIRNIRVADREYPSTVQLSARVFDTGQLRVDGHANFLEEPFAGVNGDFDIKDVHLKDVNPVAQHANLRISGGVLSASGHIEYAPKVEDVHMKDLTIDGVQVEYVHAPQTQATEAQHVTKVEHAAKEASNAPKLLLVVDRLKVANSTMGYVDDTKKPAYSVYLDDTDLQVTNFSNQQKYGPAHVELNGKFMDTGITTLKAAFEPVGKQPEFDLKLSIVGTQLEKMNNLLRAYGDFDVTRGSFTLYTELTAKNGTVNGYIKPIFRDMKVYDRRQDKSKPLLHQVYEAVVGGVSHLLENPHAAVATKTNISGSLSQPNVNTWQALLNLIQNAFFKAILPGFEREAGGTLAADQGSVK